MIGLCSLKWIWMLFNRLNLTNKSEHGRVPGWQMRWMCSYLAIQTLIWTLGGGWFSMIIVPVMRGEADQLVISGLGDGLQGLDTSQVILQVFPGIGTSPGHDLHFLVRHIKQVPAVHVSPLIVWRHPLWEVTWCMGPPILIYNIQIMN